MVGNKANGGDNDYGWQLLLRLGCPLTKIVLARIYSFQRKGKQCWLTATQMAGEMYPELVADKKSAKVREISKAIAALKTAGEITILPGKDPRYGTDITILTMVPTVFKRVMAIEAPDDSEEEAPTPATEVLGSNTPAVKEEVRSPAVVTPRAAARNTDTFAALVTTYVELLREEYPDSLLAAVDTQVAAAKLTQVWKKQDVVVSLLSTPEGRIELEAQVDLNVERIYEAVLAEQATTNAIGYFSKVIADDVFIRTEVSNGR